MAKFLFLYRNTGESYENMAPEVMQQLHQKWQSWTAEGLEKGWMLDRGHGLKTEGRVINGNKIVTDGPFVESKEIVGGFSMIQADNLDAAAELARGCPIFLRGGSVEIRPLWDAGK